MSTLQHPKSDTSPHPTGPAPTAAPFRRLDKARLREFALRHAMVLVMLLVVTYFSYRSARFGTVDNFQTIAISAAPFALIALGQTLVILTGGIDLSVGSVIAVSAMSAAATVSGHPERLWPALAVGMLVGLTAGSVNGILVSWLK